MRQEYELKNIISTKTISNKLITYLNNTKLSLSQVSQKIGVSKGHLSEIKNGKVFPALNTGLKILKICGQGNDFLKEWADFYNTTISSEYNEVYQDVQKEDTKQLKRTVSCLLAKNLNLLNCYLDILHSKVGVHKEIIYNRYGLIIKSDILRLIKENIIEENVDGVYKVGDYSPVLTHESSYDFLQVIIENQKRKFLSNELDGNFQFEISDISEEGKKELQKLNKDTMNRALGIYNKFFETNETKKSRYIFSILSGKI